MGFSIHSKKNTLSAIVSGDMRDYTISKEKLIVMEQFIRDISSVSIDSQMLLKIVYTPYLKTQFLYHPLPEQV